MMNFRILGLPRTGTTWAANWLTASGGICYHDPLLSRTPAELFRHDPGRVWGVSCTGLWLFPEWLAANPAPTLILERDRGEVDKSLAELGFYPLPDWAFDAFQRVPGRRMHFSALFDVRTAREIWRFLRPDAPFDEERHALLTEMQIQPDFSKWKPDEGILQLLAAHIREGLSNGEA